MKLDRKYAVLERLLFFKFFLHRLCDLKNLVNVADCKMYWQNQGDYVCVRVDRYKKRNVIKNENDKESISYGGVYHNLEIFRIREKQIPVDSIEIKGSIFEF
jgi:translation initiation factor 3 subunit B